MRNLLILLSMLIIGLSSCSSNDDKLDNQELYADYEFIINEPMSELEKRLEKEDSITVSFTPVYISGTMPQTKSGMIAYEGTITKLANQTTRWKYGVGENKVPVVFCGNYTISEVWRVSLIMNLGSEDIGYRGSTGEWSGWTGRNTDNTQLKYQGLAGTNSSPEFFTFIWRVVSDMSGKNYGYTRCYVPFDDQTKARLYVRLFY